MPVGSGGLLPFVQLRGGGAGPLAAVRSAGGIWQAQASLQVVITAASACSRAYDCLAALHMT